VLPLDAQLLERAREVSGEQYFVGRLLARLLPANRRTSGGWDREVAFGHGRAVEGRLEDRALIVRVNVVEPIGRRSSQLDGNQRGMGTAEDAQGDFGCGCGWQEVVSIARLARRRGCRGL